MDDNKKYLDLITSEYATLPKYKSYVKSFLDLISPMVDSINEFEVVFNIDEATGISLDILGNLVGISRILPLFNPSIPSILSDDTYRTLIKSKVFFNHWDGSMEGLESIMSFVFSDMAWSIVDNQDMTADILIVNPNLTDEWEQLLYNGYILPKPSGVRYNYTVSNKPLFGWDTDTNAIKRWDAGTWK